MSEKMPETAVGTRTVDRRKMLQYSAAAATGAGIGPALAGASSASAGTAKPGIGDILPADVVARIRNGDRLRLRELRVEIGNLPTGSYNAITDVPGVKVGYKTLNFNEPGIARTGVTIIVPRDEPIWDNYCYAGYYSHNGNGEMTGTHWIEEVGWLTSMIGITNTHQAGIVRDSLIKIESERNPDLAWRLPVVAETYDGGLNDIDEFWVTEDDVREAVADAKSGIPAEGNVGGGTGMGYFDFKGGSGTSSRVVSYEGSDYTVGVFVQSNYGYGRRDYLRINGAPVGLEIPYSEVPRSGPPAPGGSCIIIVATDAPMLPNQCRRLAVRAGVGLSDTGGIASNGSGDIYFAFSTGNDIRQDGAAFYEAKAISNHEIDPFFQAVDEAAQEALHNSATKAETLRGYKGAKNAIPLDKLVGAMQKYHLYGSGFPG